MDEQPRLKLDHTLYTIGPRGGLYHSKVGSDEPPKRIHFSHPPIHHREAVKAWQDLYLKKNHLHLSKRNQSAKPIPTCLVFEEDKEEEERVVEEEEQKEETKETDVETQLSSLSLKSKKIKNKQHGAKKVTKKKTGTKKPPKKTQFTLKDIEDNIQWLQTVSSGQFCSQDAIIQKYIQHYDELSQTSEIYVPQNSSFDVSIIKRLLRERTLFSVDSPLWGQAVENLEQKFDIREAMYEMQLNRFAGLISFYCEVFMLLLDLSWKKCKVYEISEPRYQEQDINGSNDKDSLVSVYLKLLSGIENCANLHQCDAIVLDCNHSYLMLHEDKSLLSHILSLFIQKCKIPLLCFTNGNMPMQENMETSVEKTFAWFTSKKDCLWACFCDAGFIICPNNIMEQQSTCRFNNFPWTNPYLLHPKLNVKMF